MVDLPNTRVDLPNTMVDLSNTIVDLTNTMVDLPNTMVNLPNTMVDLPSTMVFLSSCFSVSSRFFLFLPVSSRFPFFFSLYFKFYTRSLALIALALFIIVVIYF